MYDSKTEFFDGKSWKSIANYVKGDKVLQYNYNGTATLVEPKGYYCEENDDFFYEYYTDLLSNCCTGDQEIVVFDCGEPLKVSFENFMTWGDMDEYEVPSVCIMSDNEFSVSLGSLMCRMLCDAVYDGKKISHHELSQFVTKDTDGLFIFNENTIFRLSLQTRRRLLELLGATDEEDYSMPIRKSYKLGEILENLANMTLPYMYRFFDTFGDFSVQSPGDTGDRMRYSSRYVFDCTGEDVLDGKSAEVIRHEGRSKKYNLSVESGMLVLRRNGILYVSGDYT